MVLVPFGRDVCSGVTPNLSAAGLGPRWSRRSSEWNGLESGGRANSSRVEEAVDARPRTALSWCWAKSALAAR